MYILTVGLESSHSYFSFGLKTDTESLKLKELNGPAAPIDILNILNNTLYCEYVTKEIWQNAFKILQIQTNLPI